MDSRGESNPRNLAIVAVVVVLFIWWKSGGLASMPTITNAGLNQIVVGSGPKDQTRYELRSPAEFGGAVVDYDFGSHGFTDEMGGRAMLAFANSDTYAAAVDRAQRCRTCIPSQLGNNVMCLMLIPRDEEAFRQMKQCRLHAGSHFQLTGHHLALQSVIHDGQSASVQFGNTGVFLVSSISNAD